MIYLDKKDYPYFEEINNGILKWIPASPAPNSSVVLDVGCGQGSLGEAITQRGHSVWGIEANAEAADKARGRLAQLVQEDITAVDQIRKKLGTQKFDIIVFSDLLEHLPDPFSIFKSYMDFLKPGGTVLVSVPNALVWTNRFAFLFGRFEYADTGVMDRTHLRFFTFKTARRFVRAAGCRIEKVDYTPFMVRAFLPLIKKIMANGKQDDRRQFLDSPLYRFYMKAIYPIEYAAGYFFKPWFAFRIILVAKK